MLWSIDKWGCENTSDVTVLANMSSSCCFSLSELCQLLIKCCVYGTYLKPFNKQHFFFHLHMKKNPQISCQFITTSFLSRAFLSCVRSVVSHCLPGKRRGLEGSTCSCEISVNFSSLMLSLPKCNDRAWLLDLLLVKVWMVFGPELISSKNDLQYWLVWPQNAFPLCSDPTQMLQSPEKLTLPLDKVDAIKLFVNITPYCSAWQRFPTVMPCFISCWWMMRDRNSQVSNLGLRPCPSHAEFPTACLSCLKMFYTADENI